MSPEHLYLNAKKRRKVIRDNILFETYAELAKRCGVSKRTIVRDVNGWKQEGGFDEFLVQEFFFQYGKERLTNPSKALDRIITLMTRRKEAEIALAVDEIRLKWQEHEEVKI